MVLQHITIDFWCLSWNLDAYTILEIKRYYIEKIIAVANENRRTILRCTEGNASFKDKIGRV